MEKKTDGISRRGFISTAAGGLITAGIFGISQAKVQEEETVKKDPGKIIYRKLGKTDIRIPVVSMGVMNANNPEVVKASYDLGVRHFDTAAYYQGGNNEKMVGSVIRELGARKEVTIATKIYTPDMRSGDSPEQTRKKMLGQIDESLQRLQMDHVDILYVHNIKDPGEIGSDAILSTMKEIKKAGKTRYIGVSFHQDLHTLVDATIEKGGYEVILTAINFTMWDYPELLSSIERAASSGIGIIAMKTQAGSFRRSRLEISNEFGNSTVATAALKWVLNNRNITTAIPGYTTFEHMKEDFSVAYNLDYDEKEKKLLSECDVKIGMGFCRQCRMCMSTCPGGVDIPALMRTHMYAARYSNFELARKTIREIPEGEGLDGCLSCGECVARCRHEVDIAAGIGELGHIYA